MIFLGNHSFCKMKLMSIPAQINLWNNCEAKMACAWMHLEHFSMVKRQQKRHWCIEQSYGLCERGRGWEDLGDWHWNVKDHVWNELPVQVRCRRLDAWGWCTGTTQRDGMGREEGSGWGTHVYLWRIHFDIWQN